MTSRWRVRGIHCASFKIITPFMGQLDGAVDPKYHDWLINSTSFQYSLILLANRMASRSSLPQNHKVNLEEFFSFRDLSKTDVTSLVNPDGAVDSN